MTHGSPSLAELARFEGEVAGCERCSLHRARTRVSVAHGPVPARLMLVCAAPRRHEDLRGLPLAGSARNVVEAALQHADLALDEVRLTSLVRCHPGSDRTPERTEILACADHLREEIALVEPEVIVAFGSLVASVLFGRSVSLEQVAGFRLDMAGRTLIPTFDPHDVQRGVRRAATGLRRDLQTAKAVLDGRLPTGRQLLDDLRRRQGPQRSSGFDPGHQTAENTEDTEGTDALAPVVALARAKRR